jgi:hypothetical protein
MPFVLVVEPFVQLFNHTGLPLQVCQPPRADQAVDDECVAAAEPMVDDSALLWVWRRGCHLTDAKPHLRLALQAGASGWSRPLDITTALHGEDHYVMLPDVSSPPQRQTPNARVLYVTKRPVQGSNALEVLVQLARPADVPHRIVNWSAHRMSVRQAGLPGDSPWYHVQPRSALLFAWAGNAGAEMLELMVADGGGEAPLHFPLTSPPPSIITGSSAVTLEVEEEPVVDSGATTVVRTLRGNPIFLLWLRSCAHVQHAAAQCVWWRA